MLKRSSKAQPDDDPNVMAFRIVQATTGGAEPPPVRPKNPAAVELGRRGGLKGGKARAKALSPKKRAAIARKAARARWTKRP